MRLSWAWNPGALSLLGVLLAVAPVRARAQDPAPAAPPNPAGAVTEPPATRAAPAAPAAASGSVIKGKVTATYGDPLPGAKVEVKGTPISARTNNDGEFTLAVPPGQRTVVASAEGFVTGTSSVSVTEGAPATANFTLDVDLMHAEDIVVTAQVPDRKIRSSTAITTVNAKDVEARAPQNTADLMRVVPGFYVESSGGEVGNNLFVRGLPADGSFRYVAMMEDGMPVYDSTELFFVNSDIFFRLDENLDHMEAVRGGSSSLYGSNAPGGVVNFISKKGGDSLAGTMKVSTATDGLYRYDANLNGPLGNDWKFSAGGFYRFDQGVRSPGFPASNGGQFKVNLTRDINLANNITGEARVSVRYLNDRNAFFLPLPLQGQFDSGGHLTGANFVAGFPTNGTLTSREGVNAQVPLPGGGLLTLPLQDGQQQIGTWGTGDLRLYFADGRWEIQNTIRAMQVDHSWNAMLPFNLFDAETWAASKLGAGTPHQIVCTNLPGTPVFGTGGCGAENNLVAEGGQWLVRKPMTDVSNQLRLTKFADLGPTQHTFTGGLYFGHYTAGNTWYFNNIVTDVQNNPHFLDLQELAGSSGQVVRSVTDHGFENYLNNYVNGNANATLFAFYAGDEATINDKLRIDLAARVEHDVYEQNVEQTTTVDLGNPNTDADNAEVTGTGRFSRVNVGFTDWALSLGGNYAISDSMSVYARGSRGYKMPILDQYLFSTDPTDPTFPRTPESLYQAEAGLKMASPFYAVSAVAYWLQIGNFPSQDALANGQFVTAYVGQARTLGLELEAAVQPIKFLRLSGIFTLQDPRYTKFTEGDADLSGNRIRRIPQVLSDITATFMYADASVGLNWTYVGHRFSNNSNTVDLPGFNQINAVASYNLGRFRVGLEVTNALDTFGLTEGNPRVDESQGANADIFLARPVLPRRVTLSLGASL